eukprot:scaffold21018_cov65-Phaeocystis_antarctica.AAC.2
MKFTRTIYTHYNLRVLAQPSGRILARLLVGVPARAFFHLAIPPRGLPGVLVEPMVALCVRLTENGARVLRPQRGRHTKHGAPANLAALDAFSV